MRPDRTYKTYWRTRIDDSVMREPSLEVCLPESATLSDLNPALLAYGVLPGLWPADEISVQSVHDYFAGGRAVQVPMEGYEDTFFIPACEPDQVSEAISQAVAQGAIWMTNGPASILGEPIPAGVLAPSAVLRLPPEPIAVGELMAEEIADAWKDGKSNAFAIMTALSAKRGVNLPCGTRFDPRLGKGFARSGWSWLKVSAPPGYGSVGRSRCSVADAGGQAWPGGGVRDGTDDYREGGADGPRRSWKGHGDTGPCRADAGYS